MMNDVDTSQWSELSRIIDDGTNDNYGEWETKSYHKLRDWDLWKYIEGPGSEAPVIPALREDATYRGETDEGKMTTITVRGNKAEHDDAVKDAEPWYSGNNKALARIVDAVPSHQLHLVKRARFAKQAWESLRSVYRRRNTLRLGLGAAATASRALNSSISIRSDILTYRCRPNMDVAKWLSDMQRLYSSLCDVDAERMSDSDFALAILDLMPQDAGWRECASSLRAKARDRNSDGRHIPIDSITVIATIRDECWHRHRYDPQVVAHVFSARVEADKRDQKRPRGPEASGSGPPRAKRARNNKHCSNPNCISPNGHEFSDCIAYGGGSQGKYADWWRGPWNIHLPPSQRNGDNNVAPESHPFRSRSQYKKYKPTVAHPHHDDQLSSL